MEKGNAEPSSSVPNNDEQKDLEVLPDAGAAEARALSPPRANSSTLKQGEMGDEDEGEMEEDKPEQPVARQDLFVCFTNDKDLRHHETISIKASLYKGIAVRVKSLNHIWIESLLFAIESAKDQGIINLRFEECQLRKRAVARLIDFCRSTTIIESLGLIKVTFEDGQDFKRLVEAVSSNCKIRHFSVQSAAFDQDYHGKTMARCILESKSLKELDLSHVTFDDPKSFYEMANGLLNERCRLGALKLRGIQFGQLEGQVMQYILTRNKSLQTLDLSQCSTDSPENLANVFGKFDWSCNVKTLVADNLAVDFNFIVETFGEALGSNTKLEGLSLKENKLKQTQYCDFWELMSENRSLKKINIAKTEVTDKVCFKISIFLQQPGLELQDLNLSRNQIAADGLIALAEALQVNNSLKTLNLAQNLIREGGLLAFVEALKTNSALQELCLSFNKINNAGISALSGFLEVNHTLKVLDISRNAFSDSGFVDFAKGLALNKGIESLNLSKNKDVSDEIGLRQLALALASNSSLAVIDLSGLKVRKPCVIQYFQPALKSNITLKKIVGKIPPGIINEDLKDNVTIESDITSRYKTVKKESRRELSKLPLHRTEGDQTQLNLENMGNELLTPALKLIRYRRIHAVNLNNMQLEDESLRLLALYLEENPVLRSLAIADNYFTDDGLAQLIHALRSNTHLNHLNILGCASLTDQSLRALEDMVTEVNMSLYAVQLNTEDFDPDLVASILAQTAMNRAIQEHLKPRKVVTGGLIEIQFNGKVRIAEHFDSAIKAWRILGTSFIRAVNEGLSDEHIVKLCAFLSGRNLIQSLNLRRNKIGDKGAIAIADYVRKADKTLTSLELERNEIQDEGGEALLKAMQGNMRMVCCKMSYGNPLRSKICRQIETEIKANLQIKETVVPTYKGNGNTLDHYEESDRGPEFVRCALKSCELFKILHLSLPDNMIGEKEMLDIAYVLNRNTPLRTLNLRDNVVDAKASVVLAQSLRNNSHLRELDLRDNRLGNAGVAVLMEPFILQKLRSSAKSAARAAEKEKIAKEKKNKEEKDGVDPEAPEEAKVEKPKHKKGTERKLKMKMERILLNNNQQSDEALKHIFTALYVNKDIEITIDLPASAVRDSEESEDSSMDEDAAEELQPLSPTATVTAPIGDITPKKAPGSARGEQGDDFDALNSKRGVPAVQADQGDDEEGDGQESDKAPGDEDGQSGKKVPGCCKAKACRTCRELCCRDPTKRKKSCTRIICSGFLQARSQSLRYKTNLRLFIEAEKTTQKHILFVILSSMAAYFGLAILFPFISSTTGDVICIPVMKMAVYGAYCGYVVFSTLGEIGIIARMRSVLKSDSTSSTPSCNRYLHAKWIQGQIASLVTFIHIGFVASQIVCLYKGSKDVDGLAAEMDSELHKMEARMDDARGIKEIKVTKVGTNALIGGMSAILALMSTPIILLSHFRRVKYILQFLLPQPDVHRLLPNTHRNSQLAWLCNYQAAACVLESVSLSDYMLDYGGPVVAGKKKDQPKDKPVVIVEDIKSKLLWDRLKFQDCPMLFILTVHFTAHAVTGQVKTKDGNLDIIPIVQILVTCISIMSGYISYRWQQEGKLIAHVDTRTIVESIQARQEQAEERREALLEASEEGKEQVEQDPKKQSGQDAASDETSVDTNSDLDSIGLADVMAELELLTKEPVLSDGEVGGTGGTGEPVIEELPSPQGPIDEDLGATLAPLDDLGEHAGPSYNDLDQLDPDQIGEKTGIIPKGSPRAAGDGPIAEVNTLARNEPPSLALDLDNSITNKDTKIAE